jgi:hypothetical protein
MGMDPEDLKNLAHQFSDLASAVADWEATHAITDPTLQAEMDTLLSKLANLSNDLEDEAVAAAVASLGSPVDALRQATLNAQHALKVIADTQKVLKIAAAAVAVGAALVAPIPTAAGIAEAVDGFVAAAQPVPANASGVS